MTDKRAPKPMTLDERIQYGATDYIELTSGFLGATPDMPGGCQTVARVQLRGTRLISKDLLDWMQNRIEELEKANAVLKLQLDLLGGDE